MYFLKVLHGSSTAFFGFLKALQFNLHPLEVEQHELLELEELEELELEELQELDEDLQLLLLDGQVYKSLVVQSEELEVSQEQLELELEELQSQSLVESAHLLLSLPEEYLESEEELELEEVSDFL